MLFEEHSGSFSSPYLFNGKELNRETNLSYYRARYLDMTISLWLNVDPLALYNRIFEEELYFYEQHNGGIMYCFKSVKSDAGTNLFVIMIIM
ncbi:RHS repeat domain-containing protein [Flavobacterium sp. C3NV]|uniref:RHS repeat domain-containing protein n=1 Tax=Flavobacterium sp. C3NV TaxID=3393358 RepID=UPI00398FC9F4